MQLPYIIVILGPYMSSDISNLRSQLYGSKRAAAVEQVHSTSSNLGVDASNKPERRKVKQLKTKAGEVAFLCLY